MGDLVGSARRVLDDVDGFTVRESDGIGSDMSERCCRISDDAEQAEVEVAESLFTAQERRSRDKLVAAAQPIIKAYFEEQGVPELYQRIQDVAK